MTTRAEIAARARRWAEATAGAAGVALGAWWWITEPGLLGWIGGLVALLGSAVVFTGVQRARLRGREGPGIVRLDEGRLLYMGPLEGGAADLDRLRGVGFDPEDTPSWVLHREGEPPLRVPVGAAGAEALLDAFAALPGFEASRALAALERSDRPVDLWRAGSDRRVPRLD
jgi:hypothetical protein